MTKEDDELTNGPADKDPNGLTFYKREFVNGVVIILGPKCLKYGSIVQIIKNSTKGLSWNKKDVIIYPELYQELTPIEKIKYL